RTQTMPIAIFSSAEAGDMRSAFLWVCLIVIFSLAIIRLLNVQRKTRRVERTKRDESATEVLDALDEAPVAVVSRGDTKSAGGLEAVVERSLENFTLRIALSAGQGSVGLLGPS